MTCRLSIIPVSCTRTIVPFFHASHRVFSIIIHSTKPACASCANGDMRAEHRSITAAQNRRAHATAYVIIDCSHGTRGSCPCVSAVPRMPPPHPEIFLGQRVFARYPFIDNRFTVKHCTVLEHTHTHPHQMHSCRLPSSSSSANPPSIPDDRLLQQQQQHTCNCIISPERARARQPFCTGLWCGRRCVCACVCLCDARQIACSPLNQRDRRDSRTHIGGILI